MEPTPPHLPTFNVRLSDNQLEGITTFVFPDREVLESQQLESGKSFNNRIYFIQLQPTSTSVTEEFVFKLSGHYFDSRKIHNELGALALLAKYCPDVPVPRTVAWSEDGSSIHTIDGRNTQLPDIQKAGNGWILTTRIPGRPLTKDDLDGPHADTILLQLATHVAQWRNLIPPSRHIGNLRLYDPHDDNNSTTIYQNLQDYTSNFAVGGLILTHKYQLLPLPDLLSYLKYQLQDKFDHLTTAPELAHLASLISQPVSRFMQSVGELPLFKDDIPEAKRADEYTPAKKPAQPSPLRSNGSIVFTHMDLAPRNILVIDSDLTTESGGKPTRPQLAISGILDFEFSAFLPHTEEFINGVVNQPDDWTAHNYRTLLAHLATLGIATPILDSTESSGGDRLETTRQGSLLEYSNFRMLGVLQKMIANVAPWWMTSYWAKQRSEVEVRNESAKAAKEVLDAINELEQSITYH